MFQILFEPRVLVFYSTSIHFTLFDNVKLFLVVKKRRERCLFLIVFVNFFESIT